MRRRLAKSSSNRVISGVCGGLAEYFGIDVTLVRLGWVLFTFFGGSGIIAYIIAAIVMPRAASGYNNGNQDDWNHPNAN